MDYWEAKKVDFYWIIETDEDIKSRLNAYSNAIRRLEKLKNR